MTLEELHDEIGAIDAIYPGCSTEIGPQIYQFAVPQHEQVQIQISFPELYPDEPPNIIQVTTSKANLYTDISYLEKTFIEELNTVFNTGEVCLFDFLLLIEPVMEPYIEKKKELEDLANSVKEKLQIQKEKHINPDRYRAKGEGASTGSNTSSKIEPKQTVDYLSGWTASEPIEDRGSVFVGYAREVHSVEEARTYLNKLLMDRKISRAAHNMTTWRIKGQNGIQWQDCDDDGETAAGGRMLHLLQMMDVWNVIVVVYRKYGGVHLGPDRFKHINTAARNAVVKGGFANEK